MKPTDRPDLRASARSAYKTGRVQHALRIVFWIIPVVALTGWSCGSAHPAVHLTQGTLLGCLCVWLRWRGLHAERAVPPGLAIGALLAVVPTCLGCSPTDETNWLLLAGCFFAGGLGGLMLALHATLAQQPKRGFIFWGATVALFTATLGCAEAGMGAILGVTAGLAVVSLPLLLTRDVQRA